MSGASPLAGLDPPALFACAEAPRVALVAVSGGPDSMALLHLAAGWRDRGGPHIHAATVDHDLRPGSRAEAEAVGQWAGALKIPHSILTWTGDRPKARVQELARAARYRLLGDLAEKIGAEVLLTGHHADDQAETILFRLLRGSGVAGLAAMAPVSHRGGLRLVRPLLGLSKADLIAHCEALGQAFFQDPSNRDPRYARTHLKKVMADLAAEGLGRDELLRLGRRAARADEALRAYMEALRAKIAPLAGEDSFECPAGSLQSVPMEGLLRILEAEVARIGDAAPRLDRLERLTAGVAAALSEGEGFRASLAGALVSVTPSGRLLVVKAPPRRPKGSQPPPEA